MTPSPLQLASGDLFAQLKRNLAPVAARFFGQGSPGVADWYDFGVPVVDWELHRVVLIHRSYGGQKTTIARRLIVSVLQPCSEYD